MKADGFTLIEMLVVLSMLGIMISLALPLQFKLLKEQEEIQFFSMLESDVMYIQQRSTLSADMNRITFNEESYRITSDEQPSIIRIYPEGLTINTRNERNITFNNNGNIKNPRTLYVNSSLNTYRMVFPFGKGRFYLEKQ
ncbi:competence type IV pilus minor pilin ComGD [Oceanobacillus manasiensis]|uniref:competence type IV pilus minor pilin ComGD n=1 Tax=Oceanobacillus manasiensis TaxID=586413 RepID=UPI0005A9E90B|nr:competence type IV pilus minor pilin ComGD [Oceanobacillus manasiensis]